MDTPWDQKRVLRYFFLVGPILVLAVHAGFAFLEVGTLRKKNQVNPLLKILVNFSTSTPRTFFRVRRCLWDHLPDWRPTPLKP